MQRRSRQRRQSQAWPPTGGLAQPRCGGYWVLRRRASPPAAALAGRRLRLAPFLQRPQRRPRQPPTRPRQPEHHAEVYAHLFAQSDHAADARGALDADSSSVLVSVGITPPPPMTRYVGRAGWRRWAPCRASRPCGRSGLGHLAGSNGCTGRASGPCGPVAPVAPVSPLTPCVDPRAGSTSCAGVTLGAVSTGRARPLSGAGSAPALPLVPGRQTACLPSCEDAIRVRVTALRHVALGSNERVLARRVQQTVTERAHVGLRLQALRRPHLPPARCLHAFIVADPGRQPRTSTTCGDPARDGRSARPRGDAGGGARRGAGCRCARRPPRRPRDAQRRDGVSIVGYGGFAFVHEAWPALPFSILAGIGNGAF